LYEALGVEIAVEEARRIVFPTLDCAVLAVPQQALAKADRPALRPEAGGPTLNVLVTHGVYGGLGEERGTVEYGGAELSRELLVRLLVWHVERAVARDLDHAAIRGYKARALNFQLDLRRPEAQRALGTSAGPASRRQTLTETVRDFLGRRPLDAELNRETFVNLGVEYLETVA